MENRHVIKLIMGIIFILISLISYFIKKNKYNNLDIQKRYQQQQTRDSPPETHYGSQQNRTHNLVNTAEHNQRNSLLLSIPTSNTKKESSLNIHRVESWNSAILSSTIFIDGHAAGKISNGSSASFSISSGIDHYIYVKCGTTLSNRLLINLNAETAYLSYIVSGFDIDIRILSTEK